MILSDYSIREEITRGRLVIDPLDEGCIQPSSAAKIFTASRSYQEFERNLD